jgi:hypothetical protein
MSRAFVKEDGAAWGDPGRRYSLPPRDDAGFDARDVVTREAPRVRLVITGAKNGSGRSSRRFCCARSRRVTSASRSWRSAFSAR